MEVAEINCDASSAVTQQSGTWITAVGNRSGSGCAVTIAAGIFSAEPLACWVTTEAATVQAMAVVKTSATSITVHGPSSDYDANIACMGVR
jgi:hypothetical protein